MTRGLPTGLHEPVVHVAHGLLLHSAVLRSHGFAVLAAFVAVNTVMYAALAVVKLLPAVHPGDWLSRRNRRSQTRSIHPDGRPARPSLLEQVDDGVGQG